MLGRSGFFPTAFIVLYTEIYYASMFYGLVFFAWFLMHICCLPISSLCLFCDARLVKSAIWCCALFLHFIQLDFR